jgi:hypothetical protein
VIVNLAVAVVLSLVFGGRKQAAPALERA